MLMVVAVLLTTLNYQAVLTHLGGLWQDNGQCNTTSSNTTLVCEHKVGTAIALKDSLFLLFLVGNTALFSLSKSLIVLFILNSHIKALLISLNIFLYSSYFYSIWTITYDPIMMILLMFGAGVYFVLIQLLLQ